jgi:4-amino-4-deoxy-L-arabinose transferase-like glycosyltransferase
MVPQRKRLAGGLALVALSGALYAVLSLMGLERPAYVHVRWAASVDAAMMTRLERARDLTRIEAIPPHTWAYYLSDLSPENIQRLVRSPAVEDTHFIDRDTFQVAPTAARGPFVSRWTQVTDFGVRASLLGGVASITFWALVAWRDRRTTATPRRAITQARAPRIDSVFLVSLLAALLVRIVLASAAPYIHDEENTSIPLSQSISFSPSNLHLPLRGENHGALPAYLVKASSTLFGTTALAYRAIHVLIGMLTIVMIYILTNQLYGPLAARWAASLIAFNEYFLSFSARATANTPYLFFVTLAVFAFSRFLAAERARYLYAAAVATGLAFYCKEHAVLLLPVFLAMLLGATYRRWLRSPHLYLAVVVFALVIGPDLAWNLRTDPDTARVTYGGGTIGQATYSAHLQRLGGIGFSPYPAMFYAHGPVTQLIGIVAGTAPPEPHIMPEYHPVNPVIGLLLVIAVLTATMNVAGRNPNHRFLLILAWGVFIFFTLVKRGDPPYRLAAVNWVWVEATLIPAVTLAGHRLAGLTGRWRTAVWICCAVALMYAVDSLVWPFAL